MNKVVYRGCDHVDKHEDDRPVFFSSSKDFAENYGKVSEYLIQLNAPFDTCSEGDVLKLLEVVEQVKDDYSGDSFTSFTELEDSGLLYHDTWEIFEPFMKEIQHLGFDSMIIYEGGVQNFVTFKNKQAIKKGEQGYE